MLPLIGVCVQANVATAPSTEDHVEAFKEYMSKPPHIRWMRVETLKNEDDAKPRMYILAYSGHNFIFRRVKEGHNYRDPISNTNKNDSYQFFGRKGDMRWSIAGYRVTKSFSPNVEDPDVNSIVNDQHRVIMNGLITFGSQDIAPGGLRFAGTNVTVELSRFTKQFYRAQGREEMPTPSGKITVEDGRVTALEMDMLGRYEYRYSDNASLPPGIPSESRLVTKDGSRWARKYIIHEMELGTPESIPEKIFTPMHWIEQNVARINVYSNSTQVAEGDASPELMNLLESELREEAARENGTSVLNRRNIFWALVICIVLGGLVAKRRLRET